MLLVFDDLHWIDASSRELLDRIINRAADCPVLLLGMFRPEFQPPWIGQPHVTMLTLPRLDRRDTAAMVANVAGNVALPREVMEEIVERTDGVPLFVEELTKAVLESGDQATTALAGVPHPGLSVPATLHASLMARLDRLGPAAKDVAQTGAAIGREFGHDLLASVTDVPESQLHRALERLTSAGLLFVRGTPPDASYIFKHALVQDAAYGTFCAAGASGFIEVKKVPGHDQAAVAAGARGVACMSSPKPTLLRPEAYETGGELSAAIELRRRFPGITDNAKAWEQVRAIAWVATTCQTVQLPSSGPGKAKQARLIRDKRKFRDMDTAPRHGVATREVRCGMARR